MKKRKLLLGSVGLAIVAACCIMYSHQQKNNAYSYELLRVKASLEQIAQYSEHHMESIPSVDKGQSACRRLK